VTGAAQSDPGEGDEPHRTLCHRTLANNTACLQPAIHDGYCTQCAKVHGII
jgi:hypothetical protein